MTSSSSDVASKYPKLALHAPPSSLTSLSRPSTPPTLSQQVPCSQPPSRFATVEQFEQLVSGQANMMAQLTAMIATGKGQSKASRSRRSSSREVGISSGDDEEEELETTVSLGAGHTPAARSLRHGKARRISIDERGQRVQSTAKAANRDVLGLNDDQLRHTGKYLSAIASDLDQESDEDDSMDATERKVTTQHNSKEQTERGTRKLVVVKRQDKPSLGLHPDLFSPMYDEAESVVSLLSKSLSAGVKSKKKFTNKNELIDMLQKGREHAIAADGLTEVMAQSGTKAWIEYETYMWQLSIENGWEAADWYHRELFKRIALKQHDLIRDGPKNQDLLRELDHRYTWLLESQLTSRRHGASSTGDRFRTKNTGGNKGGGGGGYSKSAKQSSTFSGQPCKYHGPNARHTTAECKDPKHGSGGASGSA